MSKCPRHGIHFVYNPQRGVRLKVSSWICPECERERVEFFNSIASPSEKLRLHNTPAAVEQWAVSRIKELEQKFAELRADAERLNFLDGNLSMKIGWIVTEAPAGNISVKSVIQPNGATSIRSAIDAAIDKARGKV